MLGAVQASGYAIPVFIELGAADDSEYKHFRLDLNSGQQPQ
jgi:hypothetical protein